MQLAKFIAAAIEKLRQSGIDTPGLDARLLACNILHCDRASLLSQSERRLDDHETRAITALLTRRINHEPVARIIGNREFWGLTFGLNEATLEPRPDSETLVESVLSLFPRKEDVRILDLGTGTGCLLLALLNDMPQAIGLGIDIAPRAVEQATQNAKDLGFATRASFRVGDWLNGLEEKFDLIVSNPPYIRSPDIPALMPEVRQFDPIVALDGGADGLAPYRLLIPKLSDFLKQDGLVAFEVGQGQAQDVANLLQKNGFTSITRHKDLAGIDRCVTGLR